MSQKTNIAWATHTASPWFGCSRVSDGCSNCYAEELTLRYKLAGWGHSSPRVRSKEFWTEAYRLNRKAEGAAERPRMFTSLMDWLDPQAPIEWLADFLQVVWECRNLDWLLLTKRPELFRSRCEAVLCLKSNRLPALRVWLEDWISGLSAPRHVWFGVTVENQEMFDKRIPQLFRTPAKVRWLSVEPLLETVNLSLVNHSLLSRLDWLVVGGESGKYRRDCGVEAILSVVEQCQRCNVPVFVKQDCALLPGRQGRIPDNIWSLKQYPR